MRSEICEVMKESYDRGWISTRDGNCSFKGWGENHILITPSGFKKNKLNESDIVQMGFFNDKLIAEESSPSGELEMHWRLLSATDKSRCVLHLHPTNIIAAMMRGFDLSVLAKSFPEVFRYTRVGVNVPDLPATSSRLAAHTFASIYSDPRNPANIVGQKFHGACAIGKTIHEAFEHMERLEHICKVTMLSGVSPETL